MTDLIERLRETTEEMAHLCGLPFALWNEHSNAVLEAADRIEELEAALRSIYATAQSVRDGDCNVMHLIWCVSVQTPKSIRNALEQGESRT